MRNVKRLDGSNLVRCTVQFVTGSHITHTNRESLSMPNRKRTKTKGNSQKRRPTGRPKTAKYLRKIGGLLGSQFGPVGSLVGEEAGSLFGQITGLGEYHIRGNSLLTDNGPPTFHQKDDEVIICHREFVTDIYGSQDFSSESWLINPGNTKLFPWMAQIAHNFEQYEFQGLVFEFKTTSGTAVGSTNTGLGTVAMATQYDVLSKSFATKREMEQYEYCVSTVPCRSAIHPVECKHSQSVLDQLYVTHPEDPTADTADERFHNLGKFTIGTQGMQRDAVTVGELWVSYKLKLVKPRVPREYLNKEAHYLFTDMSLTGQILNYVVPYVTNTMEVNLISDVGTGFFDIQFPDDGQFLITLVYEDAGGTSPDLQTSPNYYNGASGIDAFYAFNTGSVAEVRGSGRLVYQLPVKVRRTDSDISQIPTVRIHCVSSGTDLGTGDIIISSLPVAVVPQAIEEKRTTYDPRHVSRNWKTGVTPVLEPGMTLTGPEQKILSSAQNTSGVPRPNVTDFELVRDVRRMNVRHP